MLISSMAMGADHSFELISIETYAPQFIGHNNFFLGSVGYENGKAFISYTPLFTVNLFVCIVSFFWVNSRCRYNFVLLKVS